jgi:phosphoglycolate phosphatase-like HAD superfamily hydrolase
MTANARLGNRPPAHVVFDWDGTLFDSVEAMHGADNALAPRFGWDAVDLDHYRAHITRDWRSYYDTMRARRGFPPLSDAECAEVHQAWEVEHEALLATAGLFPDALQVLELLGRRRVSVSVCSMHTDAKLQLKIDHLGVRPYLLRADGLVGPDTGQGKTDLLRAHLERVRAAGAGDPVAFVGDTVDDARAARANGIAAVLVATGEVPADRLVGEGCPVTSDLRDAVAVLGLAAEV